MRFTSEFPGPVQPEYCSESKGRADCGLPEDFADFTGPVPFSGDLDGLWSESPLPHPESSDVRSSALVGLPAGAAGTMPLGFCTERVANESKLLWGLLKRTWSGLMLGVHAGCAQYMGTSAMPAKTACLLWPLAAPICRPLSPKNSNCFWSPWLSFDM